MTVTPTTKEIVYNRQGGQCAECGEPLDRLMIRGPYNVEYDHMHAQWCGGPDDPDNIRAIHKRCHDPKSRQDTKDFFKCERRIEGEAAHADAMATGKRRPNKHERKLMRMAERRAGSA